MINAGRLTSYSYVPMRLKEDDVTVKPTPTIIHKPDRCEHENTICIDCCPEWNADYEILWHRTVGGRTLKEQWDAKRSSSNAS